MSSRLFTFGCSFTRYKWPTWADILGQEFNFFENWGLCGGGNLFIFNSVVECLIKNNLNKNDTVIVMWTNITREDGYTNHHWHQFGNIHSLSKRDKNFDDRGYFIRDIALIYATKNLLETNNIPYIFTSMVPITNTDQYSKIYLNNTNDAELLYKDTLDCIRPSVYESIFDFDWKSNPLSKSFFESKIDETSQIFSRSYIKDDLHPTPLEHLKYLDSILPEFFISEKIRKWATEIDRKLTSNVNFDDLWLPTNNKPERL